LEIAQQVYDQLLKSLLPLPRKTKKECNHPLKFPKLNPINLLLSKVKKGVEEGFTGVLYSAIRKNVGEHSLLVYTGRPR